MRRSVYWIVFTLVVGCFLLLIRYQYLKVRRGEIFSLFNWQRIKFSQSTCGALGSVNYTWGFNKEYANVQPIYKNIRFKGVYVGSRKTSNGDTELILKIPGLLSPQYYYFDAGDSQWYVDFDFTDVSKQDLIEDGQVSRVLPYLIKNCSVTVDVSLYNPKTDCNTAGKEQKPCNYAQKMTGNRKDNTLLIGAVLENKLFSQFVLLWRRVLHLGPIINITV